MCTQLLTVRLTLPKTAVSSYRRQNRSIQAKHLYIQTGILEIARLLHAGVGATRAAVEQGWIDKEYQIGQTGRTICPKIYFAVGISGSVQHIAGISRNTTVIAVNNNPEAPIFQFANYGVIADCNEILPEILRNIKKLYNG